MFVGKVRTITRPGTLVFFLYNRNTQTFYISVRTSILPTQHTIFMYFFVFVFRCQL